MLDDYRPGYRKQKTGYREAKWARAFREQGRGWFFIVSTLHDNKPLAVRACMNEATLFEVMRNWKAHIAASMDAMDEVG